MNKNYLAYLLRLQRNPTADHWRVTLENAHTGEVLRFASEQELMAFLWQLIGNGRLQLETPNLPVLKDLPK
jgi:hypothetical protein